MALVPLVAPRVGAGGQGRTRALLGDPVAQLHVAQAQGATVPVAVLEGWEPGVGLLSPELELVDHLARPNARVAVAGAQGAVVSTAKDGPGLHVFEVEATGPVFRRPDTYVCGLGQCAVDVAWKGGTSPVAVLEDEGVRVVDVARGVCSERIPVQLGPAAQIATLPIGGCAVAAGMAAVVGFQEGKVLMALGPGKGSGTARLTAIAGDPASQFGLVAGTFDGRLLKWDLRAPEQPLSEELVHKGAVTAVAPGPEVVSAGLDGAVATTGYVDVHGARTDSAHGRCEVVTVDLGEPVTALARAGAHVLAGTSLGSVVALQV